MVSHGGKCRFLEVIADNNFTGVDLYGCNNLFRKLTARDNTQYGLQMWNAILCYVTELLTTSGNTAGNNSISAIGNSQLRVKRASITETSVVSYFWPWPMGKQRVSISQWASGADDHRIYTPLGDIYSEVTTRHTGSGIAWKFLPTAVDMSADFPLSLIVGKVLCEANKLCTVKVWLRRTNTSTTGTLICRGGQIAGVDADVSDSIGAAADTWEEQTITFTPTQKGVVEIEVFVYGGTTNHVFVDDFSAIQA